MRYASGIVAWVDERYLQLTSGTVYIVFVCILFHKYDQVGSMDAAKVLRRLLYMYGWTNEVNMLDATTTDMFEYSSIISIVVYLNVIYTQAHCSMRTTHLSTHTHI